MGAILVQLPASVHIALSRVSKSTFFFPLSGRACALATLGALHHVHTRTGGFTTLLVACGMGAGGCLAFKPKYRAPWRLFEFLHNI